MPITVVIVEDLDIVREGIKALLDANGEFIIVGEASDGIEALRIVEKHAPDIVLMDLTLPVMEGAEAIREIKHNQGPCPDGTQEGQPHLQNAQCRGGWLPSEERFA